MHPSSETQAEPTGWEVEPESTHGSETQAEPTGWEVELESTHGSERGPSGPARRARSGQR
jgi:hypothetical protein